jgi:tetratricopeptide (TPR) repeat protein
MAKLTKRTAEQLRAHLSSLSAEDLVDVLLAQAARDDDLRDRLLIDAVRRGADTVDLKSFQRSLSAAIFDLAEGRYGAEYTSGEWAYGVHQAIGRLRELLAAGQAAAVVSLAEFALDALVEVMERADDSNGYISDLVADLEGLHHEACLVAPPAPVELAGTLFAREVDGHWDVFVDSVSRFADVLGPKGIDRFRELAEERWATVRPAGPGERDPEHWGANYRITRVMERLAELAGDVDALAAVKCRDLSMPYAWLEVAQVYAEAGRHGEALDWAERGVAAFPDRHDPRLDEFLCDSYHRAGRHADALDLAWQRFESRPDLASYQRLAANATEAGQWPEWRPKAIAVLRRGIERPRPDADTRPSRRWGGAVEPAGASNLVEVLLWEGDPDGAWQEAVAAGVPHRTWTRLAAARESKHPDDAVPIFQREVERLIETKNNRGYADAVALMDHVRELLGRAGRSDAFAPYAERVRAAHKPKRNLMKLLDGKGW